MGNRAHNRRHEGRAIRKMRRQLRRLVESPEETARLLGEVGAAADSAAVAIQGFAEQIEASVRNFVAAAAAWQGPLGRSEAGTSNHPSEGVNAAESVSRPPVTMSDVEAAAEDLGVTLLPWQCRVAEAWLRGEVVAFPGGKSVGRTTLLRVVSHAHTRAGYAIRGAWVDEAVVFEVPDGR